MSSARKKYTHVDYLWKDEEVEESVVQAKVIPSTETLRSYQDMIKEMSAEPVEEAKDEEVDESKEEVEEAKDEDQDDKE